MSFTTQVSLYDESHSNSSTQINRIPSSTMILSPRIRSFVSATFAAAILTVSAHANLLTGKEVQLETWLGQGNLDFTNIFTKVQGDTAENFHTASDGKGATFSLMSISTDNWVTSQIIGGYNPQSWSSIGSFNYTPNDADRTAFIFNLTSTTIQRQDLVGQGIVVGGPWGLGLYQTINNAEKGPSFGGLDLVTYLNLDSGDATNWSYGGNISRQTIISGHDSVSTPFSVRDIEVYTFAPAAPNNSVPDSASTLALLGGAMIGLVTLRRRFVS